MAPCIRTRPCANVGTFSNHRLLPVSHVPSNAETLHSMADTHPIVLNATFLLSGTVFATTGYG